MNNFKKLLETTLNEEKGIGVKITKNKGEYALKCNGVGSLLKAGDLVEIVAEEGDSGYEIEEIKPKLVRLENGKLYKPEQLKFYGAE